MPTSLECVAHVALAAATALAWLGVGSLVLAPLGRSGDRALDGLNRLGAGAVALALLTWMLGWFGLLYAELFVPLLAAGAVLGALELRRLRPLGLPHAWPAWQLALLALIGLYVAIDLVVTCAPISSADALLHHAAAPELFEQRHRVVETPWAWNSYQPYTVEMLVLDGFLVWDGVQGAFAPLLLLFAGTAATALGAARLAGRTVGLLAATIVLCQPFTTWVGTSTFVEPGLVLAVALALWNLVHFARTGSTPALVLTGVFAGAAAGMKYQGVAAALLIACGLVLVRDRLTVRRFALAALPALVDRRSPGTSRTRSSREIPSIRCSSAGRTTRPIVWRARRSRSTGTARRCSTSIAAAVSPARRRGGVRPRRVRVAAAAAVRAARAARAAWPTRRRRRARAVRRVRCSPGSSARSTRASCCHCFRRSRCLPRSGWSSSRARGGSAGSRRSRSRRARSPRASGSRSGTPVSSSRSSTGRETEEQFLLENTSYYAAAAWVNEHVPRDAHVAVDHVFVYPFEPEAIVWSADVLPSTAGPAETRAFVRRFGITHAVVFAGNRAPPAGRSSGRA